MTPDEAGRLREVEIDLAGHLKECSVKGQMIWEELLSHRTELRDQRRVLWIAAGSGMLTLLSLTGFLATRALHL